jgi:hypothetical protein
MFKREHHQRIGRVLEALNSQLLFENNCYFGGGTAITLMYGEFRESVDIDFLVSDLACYRSLRQVLTGPEGINAIRKPESTTLKQQKEIRADQYGLRTTLLVDNHPIKFEIILEGRVTLETPNQSRQVCGVTTLTDLDMATSKLLANSDRWADASVFSRDLIDLAMMSPTEELLNTAISKAQIAYGNAIVRDINKAIEKLLARNDWLDRCILAMNIETPKALIWKNLQHLQQHI